MAIDLQSISRAQWKEIRDRIKKGGIRELKNFVVSVCENAFTQGYNKGYENGVGNGVQATKTNFMEIVDATLRKEFGFADKRLKRFHEAFLEQSKIKMESLVAETESSEPEQQIIVTEQDKQRYMVLVCVNQFLSDMKAAQESVLFKNKAMQLDLIQEHLTYLLSVACAEMGEDADKEIMEELKQYSLYIAPTQIESVNK